MDPQQVHGHRVAHDVGDGIDRTDFVEMDLLRRRVMDMSLGGGKSTEDALRAGTNRL